MDKIWTLLAKEARDGFRNRWVVMITLVMTGLALTLSLLGSAPTGSTSVNPLAVTVVSLSSLSIFFIPLIALLLAYDSVVGEAERGTLTLLLVHPVRRTQVIIGKFLGHGFLLSVAILIGYGVAGLTIALTNETGFAEQQWGSFSRLLLSSVLLGAVFLAIGYMISAWVRERGMAAALAIGVWLLFVLLYDMGLLALLAADGDGALSGGLVKGLMLVNPTDSYRMFNLTGSQDTALLSGMAGLSADHRVADSSLLLIMGLWVVVPLTTACAIFNRRQL
ncbi:ABC transporter permease [Paremcibacter congregatus]|uniref:ABC transporter permease n=1 Tax=Paremcibacter congregatus TaxID=2043170 RepID=UPI0030EF0316|tara:strand:+ start:2186 stop:3019 length:834 start_codon:yes stop_codon:yes gene_type:complete